MTVIYDHNSFIIQATGGTVVEPSTQDSKIKGLNPATCTGREKMVNIWYCVKLERLLITVSHFQGRGKTT
jgi:hypothetical protein